MSQMEQAQYWMLMKRRQFLMKSNNFQEWNNKSSNDSWEEKAFEQDASGHHGGCIWPPRSYSCSFCKREFRSAQALGGHMNIHRRDRARLKQSLSPQNDLFQCQNHLKTFDSHFPSVVCSLDYDLDHPNSGSSIVASTLTSSRVSALSTPENLSDYTLVSSFPSTLIQEKHEVSSHHIYDLSGSDFLAVKNQRKEDFTSLTNDGFVETDLLMRFNSTVASQNPLTGFYGDMISCKRPETAVSGLSFLIKPCLGDRCSLQPEVVEPNSSSMEDIDLELRLGSHQGEVE